MARFVDNPFRAAAHLPEGLRFAGGSVVASADWPLALLAQCPVHAATPLARVPALEEALGLGAFWLKDESTRMGLGSFKALGAAFVIAEAAARAGGAQLADRVFVTASAGNHGLSVAAGARVFGARAVIYLAETVPAGFADRLRAKGAEVVVAGADYEASMAAAEARAAEEGWTLLSDSTWEGYSGGIGVMEGYTVMAAEIADALARAPDHIFLQAGVGGLAAAVTAHLRLRWGAGPRIFVVEPDAAPALTGSIEAGAATVCTGPVSAMGRLDCKEPSRAALELLAREADGFMTISEAEAATAVTRMAQAGLATSPSGGAGVAGLIAARAAGRVAPGDTALAILSESPADD